MATAYDLLAETRGNLENALARMLQSKKDGTIRRELPELTTSASVLFLNLRQINRVILQEEDKIKSETEAAKSPLDQTTLQLHNFLYEKNHYLKAIKACKDFKSRFPDMELVDEEVFFRDAPEEMQSDPALKTDSHKLMLQRLNFEMHQRKQLCKQRELLEARKKMLQENIASRKKFLSSLPSHLKALKKASLPVQQHLSIPHTKRIKQHQLAELLPSPLYILYTQLLSYKEAFGEPIDVELTGSAKEAQTLLKHQAMQDSGPGASDEAKPEEEVIEDDDDSQRRRKRAKRAHEKEPFSTSNVFQAHPLSVVLQVYDDEGYEGEKQRRLLTLKFEYLYKLNAVAVGVEGSHEDDKVSLLTNLFPNDTGLELPSQAAKLVADGATLEDSKRTSRCYKWAQHLAGIDLLPETPNNQTSVEVVKSSLSCGLAIYRQQNRVQTILKQLRSRKKSQMALTEQLSHLRKQAKPPIRFKKVPWATATTKCQLTAWTLKTTSGASSTVDTIQSAEGEAGREDGELPPPPSTMTMTMTRHASNDIIVRKPAMRQPAATSIPALSSFEHDPELDMLLDCDTESEVAEEEEAVPPSSKKEQIRKDDSSVQYVGVLRRDEAGSRTIELEFQVTIAIDYPERPPLFQLRVLSGDPQLARPSVPAGVLDAAEAPVQGEQEVHWFNELRAMEAKVNNEVLQSLPRSEEKYVLAHQIALLSLLMDKQVDVESSSSTCLQEGAPRLRRGRDRRLM